MKRVLFFDARHIAKGGIGVYIAHHLRGLVQSEVFDEIRILCLDEGHLPDGIVRSGIVPITFGPLFTIQEQFSMRGLARRGEKAVYFSPHVTFPWFPFCPTILAIHDLIWLRYPGYTTTTARTYFRLMLSRAASVCERIVCVSQCTANDVMALLKCDARKIAVIHNGVEPPRTIDLGRAAEREPYWLYVGSWKPWKRVPDLIHAFEQCLQTEGYNGPTVLKLVGDFEQNMSDDIRDMVRLSPHRDKIQLVGHVSQAELENVTTGAFALIHPAEYEGFGFTILEAMRVGTPVISTTGGSIPEVAESAAELVAPRSASALADAMMRLASNHKRRRELIGVGRERAKLFSWEKATTELTRLLERAVA